MSRRNSMRLKKIITALAAAITVLVCPLGRTAFAANESVPEKYLDARERELYSSLMECMKAVSEGKDDAEWFYLSVSKPFTGTKEYERSVKKVMYFARHYYPEYSYWADSSGFLVYDTTGCGIVYGISPVYKTIDNRIRPEKLNKVNDALSNAKAIADRYRSASAYDKVVGYAKEICALNEYNDEAADNDKYSQKNIDPWSIVYVFDGDPSTNVVCEGYAKAFQYLCSLGGIECHYVTGSIAEGYHGWNIVVIDGKSYFVDLTVCDQYPEDAVAQYHPFVLNSVKSSSAEGFSAHCTASGITHSVTYKYADNEMKYLPEDLLTLSTEPYYKGRSKIGAYIVIALAVGGVIYYFIRKKKKAADDY